MIHCSIVCVAAAGYRGGQGEQRDFRIFNLQEVADVDQQFIAQAHRRHSYAAETAARSAASHGVAAYMGQSINIQYLADAPVSCIPHILDAGHMEPISALHLSSRASGKTAFRGPATSAGTTFVLKHLLSCAAVLERAAMPLSGLALAISLAWHLTFYELSRAPCDGQMQISVCCARPQRSFGCCASQYPSSFNCKFRAADRFAAPGSYDRA